MKSRQQKPNFRKQPLQQQQPQEVARMSRKLQFRLSHLILAAALAALLVVSLPVAAEGSDRTSASDTTIDRPAHRATSFVPRLGKRVELVSSSSRQQQQELERAILCATYNLGGPDCDLRFLSGPILRSEPATTPAVRQQPVIALIGALARGIPTPDGQMIKLVGQGLANRPTDTSNGQGEQFDSSDFNDPSNFNSLLSDLVKREDSRSLSELLGDSGKSGSGSASGSKRVAFTPRIGR